MSNNIVGYSRFLATIQSKEISTKPFFGQPYIKLDQCIALSATYLQMGGILGSKHSDNLDSFIPAFLGIQKPKDSFREFFLRNVETSMDNMGIAAGFIDFVGENIVKSQDNGCNIYTKKIPINTMIGMAYQCAEEGAGLGVIYPEVLRDMYDYSSQREARLSYEIMENGYTQDFMRYCKECCPELYVNLNT